MSDSENYQYYDPSPQPTVTKWWQRRRMWQLFGLLAVTAGVLTFVVIAAVNVLKNKDLANQEPDIMEQAQALESQLMAECEEGDDVCLALARADAARALGSSQACVGLDDGPLESCLTLIARDQMSLETCKALSGQAQVSCTDEVLLLKANADKSLANCAQITDEATEGTCLAQVSALLVAQGKCAEAGVESGVCDGIALVSAAMQTGDPAACAALADEEQRYECEQGINSIDEDRDGLVLSAEFSLGLSDSIADGDGDGLSDGDEVHVHGTDPTKTDTDGDGFTDGGEVQTGYDPLT
ncbi:MAG: thrombospondin type 3 repeat-containing protein [Patescibacteria group bacterium]